MRVSHAEKEHTYVSNPRENGFSELRFFHVCITSATNYSDDLIIALFLKNPFDCTLSNMEIGFNLNFVVIHS